MGTTTTTGGEEKEWEWNGTRRTNRNRDATRNGRTNLNGIWDDRINSIRRDIGGALGIIRRRIRRIGGI